MGENVNKIVRPRGWGRKCEVTDPIATGFCVEGEETI